MRFSIYLILWFILGCGSRKNASTHVVHTDCKDTTATITFVNKKNVEQRVVLSKASSAMEKGVLVNTYKSFATIPIPKGDSISRVIPSIGKYMYTVYGPVSTNVNGMGVVNEQKFTLIPCGKLRVEL